jgi:hypothetical protein
MSRVIGSSGEVSLYLTFNLPFQCIIYIMINELFNDGYDTKPSEGRRGWMMMILIGLSEALGMKRR